MRARRVPKGPKRIQISNVKGGPAAARHKEERCIREQGMIKYVRNGWVVTVPFHPRSNAACTMRALMIQCESSFGLGLETGDKSQIRDNTSLKEAKRMAYSLETPLKFD